MIKMGEIYATPLSLLKTNHNTYYLQDIELLPWILNKIFRLIDCKLNFNCNLKQNQSVSVVLIYTIIAYGRRSTNNTGNAFVCLNDVKIHLLKLLERWLCLNWGANESICNSKCDIEGNRNSRKRGGEWDTLDSLGPGFPNLTPITLYNFSLFIPSHLSLFPSSESSFSLTEFAQQLLIHPWRPAGTFARLPPCQDALHLSFEKVILEYQPASLGPSALQGSFPLHSTE